MEFRSWRRYRGRGIEYTANFGFVDEGSTADAKLLCDLELSTHDLDLDLQEADLFISTNEELIVTPSKTVLNDEEQILSLELFPREPSCKQQLDIMISGGENKTILHLRFPSVEALQICRQIVDGEELDSIVSRAEEYYGESPLRLFYSILEDAAMSLSFSDYLTVRDRLMGFSGRLQDSLENSRMDSFKNMITSDSKGAYQQVYSAEELWERVSAYNQYLNLTEVDVTELVEHLLEYRYKQNPKTIYQEKSSSRLEQIIYEVAFLEQCGGISEPYFATHLASLVKKGDQEAISLLIETWADQPEELDFEEEKETLLDADRYGTKGEGFRRLLLSALGKSDQDFEFILFNYLYWRAMDYESRNQHLSLCPLLFSSASTIAEKLGGLGGMKERADYFAYLTEGHVFKLEEHRRASRLYQDAIDIAGQDDSAWIGSRYNYLVPAIRSKAEADINEYKNSEDYKEGAKMIDNRISTISDLGEVNPDQQEYALELLRGWHAELQAHSLLNTGEFEDSIGEAKQLFGEANGFFEKVDRDDLQEGVRSRISELEAVEAELKGDFREAADAHQRYCDQFSDTKGIGYHWRAKLVCEAKEALLKGNHSVAKERLGEIEDAGSLNREQKRLRLLADISKDYNEKRSSDPAKVYRVLGEGGSESQHLLDIPTDYTAAVTQILAAQRLREYEVQEDLLDKLVNQSLRDSLIPTGVEDIDSEVGDLFELQKASVSGRWKRELPLNIYDELIRVEEDEGQTVRYDSLVMGLTSYCLERQLTAIVEYHGKRFWGEDWKEQLYRNQGSEKHGWKDPALGDLFGFFNLEPGSRLDCAERVIELDSVEIIDDVSINRIRNDIAHGNQLRVASSEAEYEQIRDKLLELMKLLFRVTPVPAVVDSRLDDGYYLRLLRKAPPDRLKIRYSGDLKEGEVYYLPPNLDATEEVLELTDEDIMLCDVPKGLDEAISKV